MNPELRELFTGKSVAIAGYGVEGKAAYQLLKIIDCDVTIIDENPKLNAPDEVAVRLGGEWLSGIDTYDIVLRTSGMQPDKLKGAKYVTTSTDLLLQLYGLQTIGVTGTKGKTTTVKLTAELLKAAGQTVELVGNVGRSAWEVLAAEVDDSDVIVAELSSFQLSDASHSPHISGLLPITNDHLDWHADMNDYIDSKLNIIRHQSAMDTTITDKKIIADHNIDKVTTSTVKTTEQFVTQKADKLVTRAGEINITGIKPRGQHNLNDIKLAFSLTVEHLHKRGIPLNSQWQDLHRAITEFEPLEFHVELIGSISSVKVINDSYGSNPTATLAALHAVGGKKVLVLGGHTKGFEFDELMKSLDQQQVQAVVIIGADNNHCQKLADMVSQHSQAIVDVVGEQKMSVIVERALQLAAERTTILFSPAHASFDMYTNFNERGRLFTEAVQNHEGFSAKS